MQEKKKPDQEHKGLRHAFRKAVLLGVTAVALTGGLAANAQAQQYQGDSVQSQQQQKPWARDSEYQRLLSNAQYQTQLRMEQLQANERAQLANVEAQHANQTARNIQTTRRAGQHGFTFGEILQTTSGISATEQRYRAQITQIQTNYQSAVLREEDNYTRTEQRLDDTYAKKYGYTVNNMAPTSQRFAGSTANTGGSRPAAGQPLSPEDQHDRLVRAYQDAQLKSAQSGGRTPMPDPAKFGLNRNDPAIRQ